MASLIQTDICVIGAGSGGLSVAAAAAQMGAQVTLIEAGKMGGDCLNTGCVPSKSLLAAAHAAETAREASKFGVDVSGLKIDFGRVHQHVHNVIAAIAPHDSVERFRKLGVKVIRKRGRFTSRHEVAAGSYRIQARRFVIATGSRAFVPPVPGLSETPFMTNETIFEQTECPKHLLIMGGGPIGLEMAQAHRRLGSNVTLFEMSEILPKDDPALVAVIRRRLLAEGIQIREKTKVTAVKTLKSKGSTRIQLAIEDATGKSKVTGSHLLVAAGRRSNIADLGLEEAGVATNQRGIIVDARLRTSNKKIFAIGDCNGGLQFTHIAGYQAGIAIRNILFRIPAKIDISAAPWVTYTDPELAHVGLNEQQARERYGDRIQVIERPWTESDRAQAEGATEGLTRLIATPRGKVLGVSIVGSRAGEQIQAWCLALSANLKLSTIAGTIFPYPTRSESNKLIAGHFFTPKLFSQATQRFVRFLLKFG